MNFELVGIIALGLVLAGVIYWFGYSAGESDANKRILERQQQSEAAKHWKDVLEKIQQNGGVQ